MADAKRQRVPSYCALCKSRCGCISVVEDGRLVAVEPDPAHPTGRRLCAKGRAAPDIVHSPERLRHPLERTAPRATRTRGGGAYPRTRRWTARRPGCAARRRTRARTKLNRKLDPGVVYAQHGWWQAYEERGLPDRPPLGPDSINYNALIGGELSDPISGSLPLRSYLCQVSSLD